MPATRGTDGQGAAHDTQLTLHALHLDDIAQYISLEECVKAQARYPSLPRQLTEENTKFRHAVADSELPLTS